MQKFKERVSLKTFGGQDNQDATIRNALPENVLGNVLTYAKLLSKHNESLRKDQLPKISSTASFITRPVILQCSNGITHTILTATIKCWWIQILKY